jgi:hypothetical protein
MYRTSVNSEAIRSVGYEQRSSLLEIEFTLGEVYRYHRVPQAVFMALMATASHGAFFDARIKGRYPEQKVG